VTDADNLCQLHKVATHLRTSYNSRIIPLSHSITHGFSYVDMVTAKRIKWFGVKVLWIVGNSDDLI